MAHRIQINQFDPKPSKTKILEILLCAKLISNLAMNEWMQCFVFWTPSEKNQGHFSLSSLFSCSTKKIAEKFARVYYD